MRSVAEILSALGGPGAVAAALKLPYQTVAAWKGRGSIPAGYWPLLEKVAQKRGIPDLSLERFAEIAAAGRPPKARRRTAA